MKKDQNKDKSSQSQSCDCCCYDVVDSCGCIIGKICCENKPSGQCYLTECC